MYGNLRRFVPGCEGAASFYFWKITILLNGRGLFVDGAQNSSFIYELCLALEPCLKIHRFSSMRCLLGGENFVEPILPKSVCPKKLGINKFVLELCFNKNYNFFI